MKHIVEGEEAIGIIGRFFVPNNEGHITTEFPKEDLKIYDGHLNILCRSLLVTINDDKSKHGKIFLQGKILMNNPYE